MSLASSPVTPYTITFSLPKGEERIIVNMEMYSIGRDLISFDSTMELVSEFGTLIKIEKLSNP